MRNVGRRTQVLAALLCATGYACSTQQGGTIATKGGANAGTGSGTDQPAGMNARALTPAAAHATGSGATVITDTAQVMNVATQTATETATSADTATDTHAGTHTSTSVVSTSALTVISDIQISAAEGSHTHAFGCAGGYQPVGVVVDCGNGVCASFQAFCIKTAPLALMPADAPVVAGITMTAANSHINGGGACPAGSESFGSVADCGFGTCRGSQRFCKQVIHPSDVTAATPLVTVFTVSPNDVHGPGAACADGQPPIGVVADCGQAVCNGNQTMCVTTHLP